MNKARCLQRHAYFKTSNFDGFILLILSHLIFSLALLNMLKASHGSWQLGILPQPRTQGRKRWSVLILLCICIVVVASFASTFLSFLSPVDHVDCPRPSLADEACSPKESGQFCDESNVEYARLPEAPAQADLQPRREDAGTNQQHPSGFFSRSRFLLTLLRKSLSSRAPRLVLSPWFTKRRLPRPSRMVQPREH